MDFKYFLEEKFFPRLMYFHLKIGFFENSFSLKSDKLNLSDLKISMYIFQFNLNLIFCAYFLI